MDHLDECNFVSIVTSPHIKWHKNAVLHEHKKLNVWFGNEGIGISNTALERSNLCISIHNVWNY